MSDHLFIPEGYPKVDPVYVLACDMASPNSSDYSVIYVIHKGLMGHTVVEDYEQRPMGKKWENTDTKMFKDKINELLEKYTQEYKRNQK